MQLNLCPLFSGSSGNSVYMACGGVKPGELDALIITHEHIDHVRGLGVLCRRYGMPVYANEGTWQGILQRETGIPQKCMRTFYTGEDFYIGALNVHPFPIPHDAADPVGFAFDCQGLRCGARALCELAESGTRAVFLSHLSTDNNLPELAYNTVCGALSAAGFDVGNDIRVCVSRRDRVSDLLTLQTDEADAM